jgi:hypothetical protein
MRTRSVRLIPILFLILTSSVLHPSRGEQRSLSFPTSLLREEQEVRVDNIEEVWRLQWRAAPKLQCGPVDGVAFTCPCNGFAYGESGRLDLVRIRDGHELERLPLGRNFEDRQGQAVVQRSQPDIKDFDQYVAHIDEETWGKQELQRIQQLPLVKVMHLLDYDHDGRATEFFLQTDSFPCGKRAGIVIGVSKTNGRLHAFGSVKHPNKPLVLQLSEWEALLNSSGPTRVLDWACGDHGADVEVELELTATPRGIRVLEDQFECINFDRARLLKWTEL